MFCPYCGAEIEDKMKFCFNCGKNIDLSAQENKANDETQKDVVEEKKEEPENIVIEEDIVKEQEKSKPEETIIYTTSGNDKKEKRSLSDKAKDKIKEKWSGLSFVGKAVTVCIIAMILLGLIALIAGRTFAFVMSIIQIVLMVVALLMKKQIIKVSKKWIMPLLVAISIVLFIPYFALFKINTADYAKYDWSEVVLADILPEPEVPYGEITYNSEDYLTLTVKKITEAEYKDYIEECKEKGFTVDEELLSSSFSAYNSTGYKLSLYYYDYNSEMHITVDAGMELGELSWSESEMASLLPIPDSTVGQIQKDDETGYSVYVGDMTIDEYNSYVTACEEKGFTVDSNKGDKSFTAKNAESYKLSVRYEGNNIVHISIGEPEFNVTVEIECVENWIFSKYDVDVLVDEANEGTITHGSTETFELVLKKGTHNIGFENADDESVVGNVEVVIEKDETIKLKISCTSSGIDVELISGKQTESNEKPKEENTESQTSKIAVTMSEDDFKGMNYEDAEAKFREMGFTSFEYKTVDTEVEESNNTICYIEIIEVFFGDSDFKAGDEFDADSTITFYSYKYEAPEEEGPVFYSTNTYDVAKKGNTGVFSYVDRGGSYDIYWIIDFDEGYVYYFTEGNGESSCDRLKIDSGDLNSAVTITYHDSGMEWSYKLHFKYVDHPETLIMNDQNGFDYEYTTTDLDDALALRNTKKIKDY